MSMSGDRKRLERRERAQASIALAECPMPQLGLLLEGSVVPERRRKAEAPLSAAVQERGVLGTGIRPPTVPEGTARLRVTFSAAHTDAAIDGWVAAMRELGLAG